MGVISKVTVCSGASLNFFKGYGFFLLVLGRLIFFFQSYFAAWAETSWCFDTKLDASMGVENSPIKIEGVVEIRARKAILKKWKSGG